MIYSRDPSTGRVECYSDEGVYEGFISGMGDFVGNESFAEDGGPGSGNWGHKGRPGLVGGSGPGGGSQYRGGRSDIGYYSSRKDWLNGLSGEKQQSAARFLKEQEGFLKAKLKAKRIIDDLCDAGVLSETERDKRLKDGGLLGLREDMTPEEYVMNNGGEGAKSTLVEKVAEARDWPKNKEKLMKENLTEEERKALQWIYDNVHDLNSEHPDVTKGFYKLKAKALGLPVGDEPIPDELMYKAGLKERPSEELKRKSKANVDWFKPANERGPRNGSSMEWYMFNVAIGAKRPDRGRGFAIELTKDEFYDLSQRFADTLKYSDLKPTKMDTVRYALREMEKSSGLSMSNKNIDLSSLSDEEKKMIHAAAREFNVDHQEEIDENYLLNIQNAISWSSLKRKNQRRLAQDFALMRLRLMTGIEPKPQEESETYKKIQQEKEAAKKFKQEQKQRAEERSKRNEQLRKEEQERHDAGVKAGDPMVSYQKDEKALNREHMTDVVDGVNPFFKTSKESGDRRYTENCQRCVMAFVARLRGYKVDAKPRLFPPGGGRDPIFLNGGLAKIFTGAKDESVKGRTGDEQRATIEDSLKEWGDGAIGLVSIAWHGRNSAHIFVAMNDHGVIKWIDPQNPEADASTYVKTGGIQPWYTKMMRVDDKPFTHWIHEAVRPEGGQYGDHFDP